MLLYYRKIKELNVMDICSIIYQISKIDIETLDFIDGD